MAKSTPSGPAVPSGRTKAKKKKKKRPVTFWAGGREFKLPRVEGYELEEEIGRGAMGTVYRGKDVRTQATVALKFLSGDVDPDLLARFEQEANIGKMLDHEDIIRVFESGTDGVRTWIVMEYLDGFELGRAMKDDTFGVEDRVKMLVRVAIALHHAHEKGVIHRDIKPSNIFMTREGGARVLDFGIAKLADAQLTRPGSILGTPRYVAPEQTHGQEYDRRIDVFALGAVAFEMFSGQYPWPQHEPIKLLMAKNSELPQSLRDLFDRERFADLEGPGIELLHRIVHKAIEQDVDVRYGSTLEFALAMQAFLQRMPDVDATGAFEVPDLSGSSPDKVAQWADRKIAWARDQAARALELEGSAARVSTEPGKLAFISEEPEISGGAAQRSPGWVWVALGIGFALAFTALYLALT